MRKVILFNNLTLDGFFEGPDRDTSWFKVDKESNEFSISQLGVADIILFGRVTFEMMASYWPSPEARRGNPVLANWMGSTAKIVFSKTLDNVEWQNTRVVNGDAAQEITRLKQQPGKDMIIFGSGKLTASLTNAGLIDDYDIVVCPVILGSGTSLFKGVDHRTKLDLVNSRVFDNGNVLLTYRPTREGEKS